jgi:HlyD family secretion protein
MEQDSLKSLKHLIGYVPQDIALIDGTFAENIGFGEYKIDLVKVERALRMAHLDRLVLGLKDGLNSAVGERGIYLSGGQKQRVGIARALYHDPQILIFDEATSSLDAIAETAITQAIQEMVGRKTIVAIAHRLSTVENFDCIYVMDQGQIVASGTHHQLMERVPLYQRLLARQ